MDRLTVENSEGYSIPKSRREIFFLHNLYSQNQTYTITKYSCVDLLARGKKIWETLIYARFLEFHFREWVALGMVGIVGPGNVGRHYARVALRGRSEFSLTQRILPSIIDHQKYNGIHNAP